MCRLWDAKEVMQHLRVPEGQTNGSDANLDQKVQQWCNECETFMNDDFNTARVIANLFELVPVINGIKGGQIAKSALSTASFNLLKDTFRLYIEEVLALQSLVKDDNNKLDQVMSLLIEIRKEARARKDYATSDQIRDKLAAMGILLKDEKDGSISYTIEN